MSKDVVNMIANLEQMWWRPYLLTFVSTYGLYLVYPLVNVIFAAYLLICKDEQIHFFMQCKSNPKPKKVITKIKQKETKITKKRNKKRRNSRFELKIPLLIWFSIYRTRLLKLEIFCEIQWFAKQNGKLRGLLFNDCALRMLIGWGRQTPVMLSELITRSRPKAGTKSSETQLIGRKPAILRRWLVRARIGTREMSHGRSLRSIHFISFLTTWVTVGNSSKCVFELISMLGRVKNIIATILLIL